MTLAAVFCVAAARAGSAVNVWTYHNNNNRTGENLEETILTPANVNSQTFGKLFDQSVDGAVYAQPLYVSNLKVAGRGKRNVVFVATEHNSVYAFDADGTGGSGGGLIWHVNLGPSVTTPNADFGNRMGGFNEISPEVGITGTPVIDLRTKTLYVDAFTHEGSTYFHQLHAIDIATGKERPSSPVTVNATISAAGAGSSNGELAFDAKQQLQRAALTLSDGILYVAYAGYADTDPYHGWIIGFDPRNLQPLPDYIFNTTPNSTTDAFGPNAGEGGIWMAGCGFSVDSGNNLYFVTGNGSFNAFNDSGGSEYGDTFLKLSTSRGLSVVDYFTPYNQDYLGSHDIDVGSGGVLLLPDQAGSVRHLMVAGGKEGTIYLLNRDMFTADNNHYDTSGSGDAVLQTLSLNGGVFSTPGYFDGRIYYAATGDALKAFAISNGRLSEFPVSLSSRIFGYPGATPSVSANGTRNGIVWVIQREPAALVAYDAGDLNKELYSSDATGGCDDFPGAIKFTVPTVANGKVYVGGRSALSVFGLLGGDPQGGGNVANDPPAASYSGLFFEPDALRLPSSGSIQLRTTTKGGFSGKLLTADGSASFRGQWDSAGTATCHVPRKGNKPLTISLQLDTGGFAAITGTVSDGSWTAGFTAYRSGFNRRTNPAPYAGSYTVVLPGASGNSQGDGYGAVKINSSGKLKFRGALGDGTKVSQSAVLSEDGDWPFFARLGRGAGVLIGWLTFDTAGNLSGDLHWIAPPDTTQNSQPSRSAVKSTATASPLNTKAPVLSFTKGMLALQGGGLDSTLIRAVTVSGKKVAADGDVRLKLKLARSSGFFKGAVENPSGGKVLRFFGAVLQNRNFGSGYFLGPEGTGRVYFGPR